MDYLGVLFNLLCPFYQPFSGFRTLSGSTQFTATTMNQIADPRERLIPFVPRDQNSVVFFLSQYFALGALFAVSDTKLCLDLFGK
jgi:hypothetical protein